MLVTSVNSREGGNNDEESYCSYIQNKVRKNTTTRTN
jgi:hypothetical protein